MDRRWIAVAALAVAGCGGAPEGATAETTAGAGAAASERVGDEPEAKRIGRPLSALLGEPGEHRDDDTLAAIAALIRAVEEAPWATFVDNDTGKEVPVALGEWLEASPDVTVERCAFLAELVAEENEGADPREAITAGYTLGMARALLEDPEAEPSSARVQVAGAEAALRWYEAARRRGGERSSLMERLSRKRDADGGLHAWYAERGIECGDPSEREPSYRRAMLGG